MEGSFFYQIFFSFLFLLSFSSRTSRSSSRVLTCCRLQFYSRARNVIGCNCRVVCYVWVAQVRASGAPGKQASKQNRNPAFSGLPSARREQARTTSREGQPSPSRSADYEYTVRRNGQDWDYAYVRACFLADSSSFHDCYRIISIPRIFDDRFPRVILLKGVRGAADPLVNFPVVILVRSLAHLYRMSSNGSILERPQVRIGASLITSTTGIHTRPWLSDGVYT